MLKLEEIRSSLASELSPKPNHDGSKLASVLVLIYGSEPKVLMTKKSEIEKLVKDAIQLGLKGILIIKGDPSTENPNNSGLIPSKVV